MMFSSGMLAAAGATIMIALLDKICEAYQIYWLSVLVKLILPLMGFALAIYFLEMNPLIKWLK